MSLLHDLLLYRIIAKGKTVGQTELRDIVFRWLEDGMDSPYLLSFIIDIYEEDLEEGTAPIGTLKKAKDVSRIESIFLILVLHATIVLFSFIDMQNTGNRR